MTTQATSAAGAQGDTKAAGETKAADTTTAGKTGEQSADGKTTTTTDEQAAGTKPAGKDDAASQQSKAPEKYALTLPDGGRLDAADLADIEAIARGENWTNEQAQERVVEYAKKLDAQSQAFLEATTADPIYGGQHIDQTKKLANLVIDRIRPVGHARRDSFKALLDKSGHGNHLEVISFLADLGKSMAEDGSHGGGGNAPVVTKDAAELLYPNAGKET